MLAEGSPYLAMELLGGGSLREVSLTWPELRNVTLQVLDALAHAHARGVVHRDVKPANIMLAHRRGRAKLVDFGIASHESDDEGEPRAGRHWRSSMAAGTPAFMAPEQCRNEPRNQGPWTDLYALGCTLWALTTGDGPFHADSAVETLLMHVQQPLPSYRPSITLPDGFSAWLHRLLEKNPRDRFDRAAHAAAELIALAPIEASDEHAALTPPLQTLDLLTALMATQPSGGTEVMLEVSEGVEPIAAVATSRRTVMRDTATPAQRPIIRPIPKDWRVHHDVPTLGLTDAGLGLFRMRSIPLIGRERDRDTIWTELHDVADGNGPRAVVISGVTGSGKTRLASWVAERAHEIGAASVVRAVFHEAGDRHGLVGMLRAHLRSHGLDSDATIQRLKHHPDVDPLDMIPLALLLAGQSTTTPTERHAMVARQLVRLASRRPLIVLLDDAHNSADALAFVEHMTASGLYEGGAVLFLITLADEPLAQQVDIRDAVARLPAERTLRLVLDALSPGEHRMLVSELLRLAPNAAAVLQERTAGNPLYTVELLGSWIEQGVLTVAQDGYDFAGPTPTSVPDLAAVWEDQIEMVCAEASDDDRRSIELAAVMGQGVDSSRWWDACQHAGLETAFTLVDDMVAAGLARWDEDELGWSFAHAMVRESLLRQGRQAGRAAGYHRCVAAALEDATSGADKIRRATHLRAAGRGLSIGPLLFDALQWAIDRSELTLADRAQRMLEELDRAEALEAASKCDLALYSARVAHMRDDVQAQLRFAEQAEQIATAMGDVRYRSRAALQLGRGNVLRNRLDDALSHLVRAEALARDHGALGLAAEALRSQAEALAQMGRFEESFDAGLSAGSMHASHGRSDRAAASLVKAAMSASILDMNEQAMDLVQRAESLLAESTSMRGLALLENQRGEILRKSGELEAAAAAYRRALALRRQIGLTSRGVEEANLALILQRSGQHAEARTSIERAIGELQRRGHKLILCAVRSVLIASVAALGDWDAVDQLLEQVRSNLGSYRELDVAESLEAAARCGVDQGERERARALLELAIAQFDGLGLPERATACRQRVAAL